MPGARLTPRDREHIGTGLAAGLGYAEIARRLGRPTSTISREVARNGGRSAYRAADAQRATRRRARRSAAGEPEPSAPPDDGEVRRYAERFARSMTATGMARMPARVLAFLLVTESGSLTARQLGERLSASPAAISKAVRYLETFSLVRRDRIPGNRRETYRFAGDWSAVFARREALFAPWENEAREGVRIVGADTSAGARLAEMSHFFQLVRGTIRRVRRHRVRRSSPAPGR